MKCNPKSEIKIFKSIQHRAVPVSRRSHIFFDNVGFGRVLEYSIHSQGII
jgi:hypothetical protein